MVTHFYSALFEDLSMAAERRRAEELAVVTFELTEFLVDVLGVTATGARFEGKVTYHASCHLLREMGIDEQPRTLLANVEDAELVDLVGHDECCGFGGLFSIKNPEISTAMGRRKCLNLEQSGADVVAMCDVSSPDAHQRAVGQAGAAHSRRAHRRDPQQPGRCGRNA